mmetsp:Transcript_17044/g.32344  ORF Transcript_17044/g.32344 Transcript_17044/m.32344 type:complete len:139 (+) Transcript_17044:358-774(+)
MGCRSSIEAESSPKPNSTKKKKKTSAPASTKGKKSSSGSPSNAASTISKKTGGAEDSSSGKHFTELYKLGKQLGEDAFSVVKEGSHKQTHKSFAVKVVTKSKLSKEDKVALKDEIAVLTEIHHKHIIRLYDVFDEPQY